MSTTMPFVPPSGHQNKEGEDKMHFSCISCGVNLIYGVHSPYLHDEILKNVAKGMVYIYEDDDTIENRRCGLIVFTDALKNTSGGVAFVERIKKEGLGEVWASGVVDNPNSRNDIQAWFWHPNYEALAKYGFQHL